MNSAERGQNSSEQPVETLPPPSTVAFEDDTVDAQYMERHGEYEATRYVDPVRVAQLRAERDAAMLQQQPQGQEQATQSYQMDPNAPAPRIDSGHELPAEQSQFDEKAAQAQLAAGEQIAAAIADGWTPEKATAELGGLEVPAYDLVDFVVDVASGGTSALGRAGIKAMAKGEVKAGAKAVGRAVAQDVGFGAVAGASMAASEELGVIAQSVSAILGPSAASFLLTGGRKVFATWLKKVTVNNAEVYERLVKQMEDNGIKDARDLLGEVMNADKALDAHPGMSIKDATGGEFLKKEASDVGPSAVPGADEARTIYDSLQEQIDNAAVDILERPKDLPSSDKALNINLRYVETPEDIQALVDQVAGNFASVGESARRGVKSEADIKALANDLGIDERKLLKRKVGEAYNAEQLLAARWIVWKSANDITWLAKRIRSGDNSSAALAAFKQRLGVHTALQMQLTGATAEAGRALRQFQIIAKEADARARQISEAVSGSGVSVEDQALALAALADATDGGLSTAQASTFIRQATKAKTSDMLLEAWVNSLLSNPATHATNTLSNALVAMWAIPERGMAALISKIPGVGSGEIRLGEALAQSYGAVKGVRDGMSILRRGIIDMATLRPYEGVDSVLKNEVGYRPSITSGNFGLEPDSATGRGIDLLGEAIRSPGKALQIEDDFFKSIGYRMELHALAYRTASSEGLTGDAFASRVRDIVSNPPESIKLSAIDASRYQTFTNELGKTGKAVMSVANSNKAIRLIVPFIRTPANVMKYALERGPAAPIFREFLATVRAGGPKRDLALARMALGSLVMASAAELAASGYITGGGPKNPNTRSLWLANGNQPYSMRFSKTGTWYSFARFEPLGSLLGMAADTYEIVQMTDDPNERDNIAATATMAFSKNITSKTFLRGISDLMEAMSDPERYGERWINSYAGTLVPAGVAQVNRSFVDPVLRDTQGWLDQIKSRTPGLSDNLPARTDPFGNDIVLGGALGPDIMSPIYTSDPGANPAAEELLRIGYDMPKPKRVQQIAGVPVELDPFQYYRLMRLYGQETRIDGLSFQETVTALADGTHPASGKYQGLSDGPDGGKVLMVQKVRQAFLGIARAELVKEFPELGRIVEEKQFEQQAKMQPGGAGSLDSPPLSQ